MSSDGELVNLALMNLKDKLKSLLTGTTVVDAKLPNDQEQYEKDKKFWREGRSR